jgi:cell shape-determining protein MreC
MTERYCIVCGKTITHHHKYCEKHYPQKSATILSLKTIISEQRKKITELEHTLSLKKYRGSKQFRNEFENIKRENKRLRELLNSHNIMYIEDANVDERTG